MKGKLELFSGVSDEGKLQKNVTLKILAFLLLYIGKRVKITIEIVRNTRSHRQNRYYWGVVVIYQIDCFRERWGAEFDKDQVHDWNKINIWFTEHVDIHTGEIHKMPGSSKTKTVGEFEERLEKLRRYFDEQFEWRIPLPNEQLDAF